MLMRDFGVRVLVLVAVCLWTRLGSVKIPTHGGGMRGDETGRPIIMWKRREKNQECSRCSCIWEGHWGVLELFVLNVDVATWHRQVEDVRGKERERDREIDK